MNDSHDPAGMHDYMPGGIPGYERLHPGAAACLGAPSIEKIQFVLQDRMIRYPHFDEVVSIANWMVNEPRRSRARGVVVSSSRGNGKSTLAGLVQKIHNDAAFVVHPCVVGISMSGARDARTVYGRILEALGSPARISHRLGDREMLLVRLLRSLECRLLVLDEVQYIALGSEREQQRALEGIKFLMNDLKLHVLGFGTEGAFGALASDPHLESRFKEFVLPRWKADSTLANFLVTYERYLPFRHASNLGAEKVVKLMAKIGQGSLDPVVTRLQNAALAAIIHEEDSISFERLESSVDRPGGWDLDRRLS